MNNNIVNYIGGFFDGEGCMSLYTLTISNTKLYLLKFISKELNKLTISNKIVKVKKDNRPNRSQAYIIRIQGRENLKKFFEKIPIRHLDKYEKLKKYLKQTESIVTYKLLNQIKKYHKQGMNYFTIAKLLRISRCSVCDYMRNARIPNS